MILFLSGPLKERIWGSNYFKENLRLTDSSELYGELWSCSAHNEGNSIIINGEFKGKTLKEVYDSNPELFGYEGYTEFPVLVKLISTSAPLSIQVHPNDDYALINENQYGKTEGWLILDKSETSQIVIGHKACNKNELQEFIDNDNYEKLLNYKNVEVGEFYPIYPGTIHAIGEGLLILEIQQSSDITYRFYDYHRKDKNGKERELHLEKALDVVNYNFYDEEIINCLKNDNLIVWDNDYFIIEQYNVSNEFIIPSNDSAVIVNLISGEITIDDRNIYIGESFIITKDSEAVPISGNGKILVTRIKNKL